MKISELLHYLLANRHTLTMAVLGKTWRLTSAHGLTLTMALATI